MTAGRSAGGDQARARAAGFTLIELLVALTLVGLISVALFGGLRFGARVWEEGGLHSARLAEIETVQSLLRRQLAQVHPPVQQRVVEDGARAAAFAGEADGLRFVAPLPSHIGIGGLYAFDLAVSDEEDRQGLVLRWRLYRPDETEPIDESDGEARLLLDGIEAAEFAYFGAWGSEDEPRWSDRWDEESRLPELIALRVVFPPGDPRRWPELRVAPKAAGAPGREAPRL